jgi:hypothetical protein
MFMQATQADPTLDDAIAALSRDIRSLPTEDACARIAWLRHHAMQDGHMPAAAMADGLADALRREGSATPLQSWLDALAMAVGCRGLPNATAALFASVGVRYAV